MAVSENSRFFEKTFVGSDSGNPRSIGQYDLLELLGRGGMGVVWKGRHRHLGQVVAVKFLAPDAWSDPIAVARFYSEMRAVGRVSNPHIVRALDAGEFDGQHILVMEYVEGITIKHLQEQIPVLDVNLACQIALHAARGLAAIHDAGMIHRDIKPSNLFLTRDGIVKVLDLGLAKEITDRNNSDLTITGHLLGTVDFMSPEQSADPKGVDPRADLYSLGCTLYALLAGNAPFSEGSQSLESRLRAHRENPPRSLRELRPEIPAELDQLVLKLLAKSPAERYQTAQEVVRALEPFTQHADIALWLRNLEHSQDFSIDIAGKDRQPRARVAGDTSKAPLAAKSTTRFQVLPPAVAVSSHLPAFPKILRGMIWGGGGLLLCALLFLGFRARPEIQPGNKPESKEAPPAASVPVANITPPTVPPHISSHPVDLKDYTASPLLEWQQLLTCDPTPVFMKSKVGLSHWDWNQSQEKLHLTSDDYGLIGLGTTSSLDYELQFGIHQNQWTSGSGVFIGLKDWTSRHLEGDWSCLKFEIVELRDPKQASTYRLDACRLECRRGNSQRSSFSSSMLGSQVINHPRGETTFQIMIQKGRLFRVQINGLALSKFQEGTMRLQTELHGGFGALVSSGSATFRSCRFRTLEPTL